MLLGCIDTVWADKPKMKVNDSCYTPSLETSRTEMILLKRHNFNCFFISFQPVGLTFPVFSFSYPIILAMCLGFLMVSKQLSSEKHFK